MQIRADATDGVLRVQVVSHLIGHTHIAIEVEIDIYITNTKMTAQIINKHVFCSFFVNLLFFAKEGKQADKTRKYNICHVVGSFNL